VIWLVLIAPPATLLQGLAAIWPWTVAAIILVLLMIGLGCAAVALGSGKGVTPREFTEQLQRALKSRVNLGLVLIDRSARSVDQDPSWPNGLRAWSTFTAPAILTMAAAALVLASVPSGEGLTSFAGALPSVVAISIVVSLVLGAVAWGSERRLPGNEYSVGWVRGMAGALAIWRRAHWPEHGALLVALGTLTQVLAVAGMWVLVQPLHPDLGAGNAGGLALALALAGAWRAASMLGSLVPAAAGVAEAALVMVCVRFGLPMANALSLAIALRVAEGVPTFAGWLLARLDARAELGHDNRRTERLEEDLVPAHGSSRATAMSVPSRAVIVLEPGYRGEGSAWASAKVAGLPLIERAVRGLARVGVREVICWSPNGSLNGLAGGLENEVEAAARREGVRLSWAANVAGVPATMLSGGAESGSGDGGTKAAGNESPERVDSGEVIIVPAWASWSWRALREALQCRSNISVARVVHNGRAAAVEDESTGAVEDGRAGDLERGPWLVSVVPDGLFWNPMAALTANASEVPLGDDSWTIVKDKASRGAAERSLFATIYKASDGLHARANRRLSLGMSRWLLYTPLTANVATLLVLAVSLLGAAVIAQASWPALLLGSSLVYLGCVLDGVDGEIARLKYQESDLGCWLDTIGDYIFYVATIGAFGWAVYVRQEFDPFFGMVAVATLLGLLLTLFVLAWQRHRLENEPERYHDEIVASFDSRAGSLTYYLLRNSYHFGKRSTMPYYMFIFVLLRWEAPLLLLICLMTHVFWPTALVLRGRRSSRASELAESLPSTTS